MALDFYRLDNNEYLFKLNEEQFSYLQQIFISFSQWTGLVIDAYSDFKLTTENQQTLIKVIEKYIEANDLNVNKKMTSVIIEFKGLLHYFISKNIDIQIKGD